MTKTKRQLRAEAVERLKMLDEHGGGSFEYAILGSDKIAWRYMDKRDALIDLLTDDDSTTQEDDSTTELVSDEAEAIAAWNSRAAMEFDNWFYLPKPKEPIVEVTETTYAWDGMKVKTDVFYRVQEQAVINWAKELDEHIIKRICEVWNSRAERTCKQEERGWGTEGDHARVWLTCGHDCMVPTVQDLPNYCPNCGCKVVDE